MRKIIKKLKNLFLDVYHYYRYMAIADLVWGIGWGCVLVLAILFGWELHYWLHHG